MTKVKQTLVRKELPQPKDVDFKQNSTDRLRSMREAGKEVLNCHRVLVKTGSNIVGELLRDSETFFEWDHYPAGDVFDEETNSQYYYHAHPQELRGGEHGHFHTFMRPKGMPGGVKPAMVPNFEMPQGDNEALSHLIAVSMDEVGVPTRLFTTNRWVTGEVWYGAEDVRRMLDVFEIDHAWPSWPVNRWVGAMIRLFRPQIASLIDARDAAVATWKTLHPDRDIMEDRELEVTSVMTIDIDRQIAAIDSALAERG